ncbi:MAG: hypothetical protein P9M03_04345, partial [Candidatus Theseobacter exili]|nr:hypothetical protein [Candidatus Theseobacter exili]
MSIHFFAQKRRGYINSTALLITAAMVFTQCIIPYKSLSALTGTPHANSAKIPAFDPASIPAAFCHIGEQFGNDPVPSFFLIKDLHCHFEAQMNISRIIDVISGKYSVNLVLVEGATGLIDTSLFAAFPDNKVKRQVASEFVKKGQVTGPEFLSITREKEPPLQLYGLEDESVYLDNLKAFRNTLKERESTDLIIGLMMEALDRIKSNCYPKPLLKLDQMITDQELGQISFIELSRHIITDVEKLLGSSAIDTYPNTKILAQSLEEQDHFNIDMLKKERTALLEELEQSLVKEDLAKLVKQSLAFRLGRITAADFFTSLEEMIPDEMKDKAKRNNPNLFRYILVLRLQSEIDNTSLMDEIEELGTKLKKELFTSPLEHQVDDTSKIIHVLRKLFHLEVNRDELSFFQQNESKFQYPALKAILDLLAKETDAEIPALMKEKDFAQIADRSINSATGFYSAAIRRDNVLIENALSKMKEEKASSSIMLSGGFHTLGITRILREKQKSYVVITPMITTVSENTPYQAIMLDDRLDAYISGQNNALASMSNFSNFFFNQLVALEIRAEMADEMVSEYLSTQDDDVEVLFKKWQADAAKKKVSMETLEAIDKLRRAVTKAITVRGPPALSNDVIEKLVAPGGLTAEMTLAYLEESVKTNPSKENTAALQFAKSLVPESEGADPEEGNISIGTVENFEANVNIESHLDLFDKVVGQYHNNPENNPTNIVEIKDADGRVLLQENNGAIALYGKAIIGSAKGQSKNYKAFHDRNIKFIRANLSPEAQNFLRELAAMETELEADARKKTGAKLTYLERDRLFRALNSARFVILKAPSTILTTEVSEDNPICQAYLHSGKGTPASKNTPSIYSTGMVIGALSRERSAFTNAMVHELWHLADLSEGKPLTAEKEKEARAVARKFTPGDSSKNIQAGEPLLDHILSDIMLETLAASLPFDSRKAFGDRVKSLRRMGKAYTLDTIRNLSAENPEELVAFAEMIRDVPDTLPVPAIFELPDVDNKIYFPEFVGEFGEFIATFLEEHKFVVDGQPLQPEDSKILKTIIIDIIKAGGRNFGWNRLSIVRLVQLMYDPRINPVVVDLIKLYKGVGGVGFVVEGIDTTKKATRAEYAKHLKETRGRLAELFHALSLQVGHSTPLEIASLSLTVREVDKSSAEHRKARAEIDALFESIPEDSPAKPLLSEFKDWYSYQNVDREGGIVAWMKKEAKKKLVQLANSRWRGRWPSALSAVPSGTFSQMWDKDLTFAFTIPHQLMEAWVQHMHQQELGDVRREAGRQAKTKVSDIKRAVSREAQLEARRRINKEGLTTPFQNLKEQIFQEKMKEKALDIVTEENAERKIISGTSTPEAELVLHYFDEINMGLYQNFFNKQVEYYESRIRRALEADQDLAGLSLEKFKIFLVDFGEERLVLDHDARFSDPNREWTRRTLAANPFNRSNLPENIKEALPQTTESDAALVNLRSLVSGDDTLQNAMAKVEDDMETAKDEFQKSILDYLGLTIDDSELMTRTKDGESVGCGFSLRDLFFLRFKNQRSIILEEARKSGTAVLQEAINKSASRIITRIASQQDNPD